MSQRYGDIIHLPHHVSPTRLPMSLHDRAAQFSPFAALTGYEAAIRETARLTDSQAELSEERIGDLNDKLRKIAECLPEQPRVTMTYFVPDLRKSGGAYVTASGPVRKIDLYHRTLLLSDGTEIPMDRIYDIAFCDDPAF